MTTLPQQLIEDATKNANNAKHMNRLEYNRDYKVAIGIAIPYIEIICKLASALEKVKNIVIEDTCDECGTFVGIRYAIKPAHDALSELQASLKNGGIA